MQFWDLVLKLVEPPKKHFICNRWAVRFFAFINEPVNSIAPIASILMGQTSKDRQIIWLQLAISRLSLSCIVLEEKNFPRLSALILWKLLTEIPILVHNFGSWLQIVQEYYML